MIKYWNKTYLEKAQGGKMLSEPLYAILFHQTATDILAKSKY